MPGSPTHTHTYTHTHTHNLIKVKAHTSPAYKAVPPFTCQSPCLSSSVC